MAPRRSPTRTWFRDRFRFGFGVTLFAFVVLPAIIGFVAAAITDAQAGFPGRFERRATAITTAPPLQSNSGCKYDRDLSLLGKCVVGAPRPGIDGVLLGDSYAGMHVRFMDVLAKDADLSFRHRWYHLSPPMAATSVGRRPDPEQVAYTEGRQRLLVEHEFAVLISVWGNYQYEKKSRSRLWDRQGKDVSGQANKLQMEAIGDLLARGVKVILVDRPRAPPGAKLMKRVRKAHALREPLADFRVPIKARGPEYLLELVKAKYEGVVIIRPDDAICDDSTCAVAIGDTLLYKPDGSHLTHEGSRVLGEEYLKSRANPLVGLH